MNEVEVPVSVSGDSIVVQDLIDLRQKPKDMKIRWVLQTSGWQFARDGITIHNHGTQFSDPQWVSSGREFQWKDKNDDSQYYKYDIKLEATDGSGRTLELDPGIFNGP